VLVIATLLVAALVLHLWNLEWGEIHHVPGWPWPPRTPGRFATVSWDRPFEPDELIIEWGPESESEGFNDLSGWRDPKLEFAKAWVVQEWRAYKTLKAHGEPESWKDYLRQKHRVRVYFGLWSKGSDADSWIWGIFAPIGMLVGAAYLLLGTKPQSTA
jgi:hypothetical protein